MDIFEKCNQRYIQDEVRDLGIYPYFHALESRQDTEVIMEGKRRIMLGSNNYLGLTTNSSVIEAGVQAYRTLGSGCSGSRFLNGTLKLHLELEDELAKFLRKDAVVTFSTGFQSNLGIISAIVGRNDYVICDRENHASIYDGCKLSYGARCCATSTTTWRTWKKKLQKVPGNGRLPDRDGRRVLHGRRHCQASGDRRPRQEVRRKGDGGRRARPRRHRRGRPRHGKLLRARGSGRYLHGHVLQVARLARRLYGSQQPRGGLCAPQFASVHLLPPPFRPQTRRRPFVGPCASSRRIPSSSRRCRRTQSTCAVF